MQKLDRALLVVSFGTTHEETRRKTIDAIEQDLAEAFPDRRLYRGWTSRMIVKRIRQREEEGTADPSPAQGPVIYTLEEALDQMAADGIRDILVQPTHIIFGEENARMMDVLRSVSDKFDHITVGRTLLETPEDMAHLAKIMAEEILTEDAFLVLMGHGSASKPQANQVYTDMQDTFRRLGYDNVFVATVEGEPVLEDVLEELGQLGQAEGRKVYMAPMMIVAGDHAKNDMAGDEEDSWKNRLEAAGFTAIPVLRGLGEYPEVRSMIREHALAAKTI